MTLDEFKKSLEKKHDMVQDEITKAKEEQKNTDNDENIRMGMIKERIGWERLSLIDWIIGETNKIEITKPKMREFL